VSIIAKRKGNRMRITTAQRNKYAIFDDGSYPIFNRQSAQSALRLRGRGNLTKSDRLYLIKKAMKYAPQAAKKALARDKKAKKV
tara:strand:+ start:157 stop:408 length:252 start_codon:yes stop_codon:yes gene_type:complete